MMDVSTSFDVNYLFTSLIAGDLNIATVMVWLVVATALSIVGGAIGGMILAGKDIGYQFSAMLGGLFAPAGVIPAIFFGLVVLNLLRSY